jgi:hypothetical protein
MRPRTIYARVACWVCDLGTLEPSSSRVDTKRSNPASLTSPVRRAGHDVLPSVAGVSRTARRWPSRDRHVGRRHRACAAAREGDPHASAGQGLGGSDPCVRPSSKVGRHADCLDSRQRLPG